MSQDGVTVGFQTLQQELTDYPLPVEGSIPDWLDGRLVRNGPGKFEAGDESFNHWFDGLAMLRSYTFADGTVRLTNRFLRTDAYESATSGDVTGQFATDESGWRTALGWLRNLGPPTVTDNANVHVAEVDGALLALTEVPRWTRVDPASPAADTEFAFADDLDLDMSSPHLSRDPHAEEYVGFGVSFGYRHSYEVYRIPDGRRERVHVGTVPTSRPAYIHDCAITRQYALLVEVPLRIAVLRGLSPFAGSFFDMLEWEPERGTRFLVVDRETGEVVADPTAPPVFAFHTVNAYEDGNEIVFDLIDFEDASIVDALSLSTLREAGYGDAPSGRLARYRIDPTGDGSVSRRRLYDGGMELPVVARSVRARKHRYVYGQATDREGANGLAKVDTETGTVTEWWERGCYLEEPRVVQRPGADAEDDGVVLVPALDTDTERTHLLVFDAETLTELARAELPHHHPFGFHGRFFPT